MTIPANLRTPGFYIEFSNSAAGIISLNTVPADRCKRYRFNRQLPAKSVPSVRSAAQKTLHGKDSQLYKMVASDNTDSVFAAAGDERFDYVISALNSDAEYTKLKTVMESRYNSLSANSGIGFIAKKGTYAELSAWGSTKNSHVVCAVGFNGSDQSEAEWAAAFGAKVAESLTDDPARPLQTLPLTGLSVDSTGKFTQQERNNMLYDGISSYKVSLGGDISIERAITLYQMNAAGSEDASYLDVTTPATLMYIRRYQINKLSGLYPRHKLAKDGTNFPPGQPIVTPVHPERTAYRDLRRADFSGRNGRHRRIQKVHERVHPG
ncbi:hypothetical protein CHS0354_018425 [Potamilus streckersoni]|uniref:Tail sheath protein subtilisin-like domain-containing protein n=1 Tax=Potamilus streckersoni TaxID=2493646 RepID=A0AAE0TAL7_9BIVA|nr:hypothetical protein CHS0354_018425 [Potamilus streckersoni]